MALTLSGTNGVVGAGFTVDASGVSVTAGVGTFSSLSAAASGLTGALPALDAANLTSINAAQLVGVCTSGLTKTGGFGKILQVEQTLKTDAFSTTSTTYTDITGLSVNITPSSSSNKVLVEFIVACGNNTGTHNRFDLVRQVGGSDTVINPAQMDDATAMFFTSENNTGYMRAQVTYKFLDTPNTTSQVNYRLRTKIYSSSYTQYVNRADYSTNTTGSSTITVMEVAA